MVDQIDAVLLDHAHLEKKAASTALTLLFRYPHHAALQRPLSELAREELRHFEAVLGHLAQRGVRFGPSRPSPYAERLSRAVRKGEPERLIDTLLVAALIEARSCERMQYLAEALPEGPLAAFYGGLLRSEARHHALYVDLAAELCGAEPVRLRLAELAAHEAEVAQACPAEPRLHSRAPTSAEAGEH